MGNLIQFISICLSVFVFFSTTHLVPVNAGVRVTRLPIQGDDFSQLRSIFENAAPVGSERLMSTLDEQLQLGREWHCQNAFESNIRKIFRYEIKLRKFVRFGELIVDSGFGSGKLFVFDASKTFVGIGNAEVNNTNVNGKGFSGEGINEFVRVTDRGELIFERVNSAASRHFLGDLEKESLTPSLGRVGFFVDAYTVCK